MTLPNPENYDRIEVSGKKTHYGYEAPYCVVGVIKINRPDPNWEGMTYEDEDRIILEGGFLNHQVAEYWMKQYLEMYVSLTYFESISLEGLYEDLDSSRQKG